MGAIITQISQGVAQTALPSPTAHAPTAAATAVSAAASQVLKSLKTDPVKGKVPDEKRGLRDPSSEVEAGFAPQAVEGEPEEKERVARQTNGEKRQLATV